MTKLKTALLSLGVLYGFGAAPVNAGTAMPKPLVAEKAPKAAPAVSFSDAAGARHALKEYRGHYLLVNMWATWCAPCVAELPALAKLKAAAPNLTVLAVDLTGRKETPAKAEAFLKEHHAAALGTAVDTDSSFMRNFTAAVMPTTVLIAPDGKVIARAEGPAEWASPVFIAYFKNLK
ncbi:MAG: TlpA family protein disulfide reductase [Alphaproteobacteria bacterium]|nr:TlpA family protein disulfide reductase [Alphaproteobacteria bacterium]